MTLVHARSASGDRRPHRRRAITIKQPAGAFGLRDKSCLIEGGSEKIAFNIPPLALLRTKGDKGWIGQGKYGDICSNANEWLGVRSHNIDLSCARSCTHYYCTMLVARAATQPTAAPVLSRRAVWGQASRPPNRGNRGYQPSTSFSEPGILLAHGVGKATARLLGADKASSLDKVLPATVETSLAPLARLTHDAERAIGALLEVRSSEFSEIDEPIARCSLTSASAGR
ncbi:hypothetical protein IE81DRAFT_352484 [Ceraceosorus guamensis]|uniref:Uncharacterized protein n=1 Tax=Ceraceosorus guamensis TaxID=1522189 RepID=A0A316W6H1_9BASI|nr:hypothetical protein IE81DRAFT_352484 [Ceraceosorus guamensis]PWN44341.1 hypothetical protein IE81DRAFT_352484 [Ceraceosorus guamensis]